MVSTYIHKYKKFGDLFVEIAFHPSKPLNKNVNQYNKIPLLNTVPILFFPAVSTESMKVQRCK